MSNKLNKKFDTFVHEKENDAIDFCARQSWLCDNVL